MSDNSLLVLILGTLTASMVTTLGAGTAILIPVFLLANIESESIIPTAKTVFFLVGLANLISFANQSVLRKSDLKPLVPVLLLSIPITAASSWASLLVGQSKHSTQLICFIQLALLVVVATGWLVKDRGNDSISKCIQTSTKIHTWIHRVFLSIQLAFAAFCGGGMTPIMSATIEKGYHKPTQKSLALARLIILLANSVAFVVALSSGLIAWHLVLTCVPMALVGGYFGPLAVLRLGSNPVKVLILSVGFLSVVKTFIFAGS